MARRDIWAYNPDICDGDEVWKPVKGYEGLYEVSNHGRVRRLMWRIVDGKDHKGYRRVNLCKNGEQKPFLVHRLVAEAFLPNPDGYPFVNHMDECPSNNCASNLEWCSPKHNANWGTINERKSKNSANKVCVVSVNCKTGEKEIFDSITSAYVAVAPGKKGSGSISEAAHGKRKSAYGRYWFFMESEDN